MFHDIPLGNFGINERTQCYFECIAESPKYYPYEMKTEQSGTTFLKFLQERVTPKTRQGIMLELKEAGFERYSFAAILLASNGRDCSDPYWVRFKDGPQTWKEVWEAIGVYNRV